MADTTTPTQGEPSRSPNAMTVEVGEYRATSPAQTVGGPEVTTEDQDGDLDAVTREAEGADQQPEKDASAQDDTVEESASKVEDLGDYDPADSSKFDTRYFREDGKLNEQVLQAEWFGNSKDGKEAAKLNEGTYKYLEDKLGLSRELVDNYGRGLEALRTQQSAAFVSAVGGQDKYDQAIEWARSGGYSKAQQERYNALLEKGGQDAEDARDALMTRHHKATRADPKAGARRGPQGAPRPANAQRDVTRSGGARGSSVEGFATREEASAAYRALPKGDIKARNAWHRRVAASPKHVQD